jgi:hypothetical protein
MFASVENDKMHADHPEAGEVNKVREAHLPPTSPCRQGGAQTLNRTSTYD